MTKYLRSRWRLVLVLILSGLSVIGGLAPVKANAADQWRPGNSTIILIHGVNFLPNILGGSGSGWNCQTQAWGDTVNYLNGRHEIDGQSKLWGNGGTQDIRTLQFYNGDSNCGRYTGTAPGQISFSSDGGAENLNDPRYTKHCSGYFPEGTAASEDGTNNESIYRLSCLLNWYLSMNFGHPGWNVEIVAFSMGGLIIRNAIYQIQQSKATWTMPSPSQMPGISDVVTLQTPHGGVAGAASACPSCTQGRDLDSTQCLNCVFMNEMFNWAQDPQGINGTDWTLIGSDDGVVGHASAIYMDGGHKSYFQCNNVTHVGCYGHGNMMTNEGSPGELYDASIVWCDGSCTGDPGGGSNSWITWFQAPHALHHVMYALWLGNW